MDMHISLKKSTEYMVQNVCQSKSLKGGEGIAAYNDNDQDMKEY